MQSEYVRDVTADGDGRYETAENALAIRGVLQLHSTAAVPACLRALCTRLRGLRSRCSLRCHLRSPCVLLPAFSLHCTS